MSTNYTIYRVYSDEGDWEGLYINDELQLEGHSINVHDLLGLLSELYGFKYDAREVKMDAYKFAQLPLRYSDLDNRESLEDKQKVDNIPENLYYAVQRLKDELDKETLGYIKRNGYIGLHHGLGTAIRNKWGLLLNSVLAEWFKNALGIEHADDMSGIILESLHRELNGRDWKPEEQAQKYKDYWNNLGKPI